MIEEEGGRARTVKTDKEKKQEAVKLLESMDDDERALVTRFLLGDENAIEDMESIEDLHYKRKPLPFHEWVEDEYFSDPASKNLYKVLKEDLAVIFEEGYFEILETGSIGWGKSFSAVTGMLYSIYLLTCLKDPHQTYGLAAGAPVYFIFLSTTKLQASRTIFEDFKNRMQSIEYFQDLEEEMNFHSYSGSFGDWMKFICISPNSTDAIGLNVFGGIMDEVNYGSNARILKGEDSINSRGRPVTKVEKIYASIIQRIKSRFMKQGSLPGVLFVISSKNNEMDFTAQRISEAKNDPRVYVMDYAPWDVKPKRDFSGKKFRVFFGGRSAPSKVLAKGEDPPFVNDDLAEVIEIPIEYLKDFERDIETAIRDIAGKQVPRITLFLPDKSVISSMWKGRENDEHPYETVDWICGNPAGFRWDILCDRKTQVLAGNVEEDFTPKINPDSPRHIHIDPSIVGDATGICMGHVERWVDVVMRDRQNGEVYKELRPLIYIDLVLRVLPPKNGEIDQSEVRRLIYELENRGFIITYVSADSYQSRGSLQQLKKKGYKTEIRSLDRKPDGYLCLKDALREERVRSYEHDVLRHELERLKRDNATGKVDHPKKGSKDLSDSLAGVVWSLTEIRTAAPGYFFSEDESKSSHPLEQWEDVSGGMGGVVNLGTNSFLKG